MWPYKGPFVRPLTAIRISQRCRRWGILSGLVLFDQNAGDLRIVVGLCYLLVFWLAHTQMYPPLAPCKQCHKGVSAGAYRYSGWYSGKEGASWRYRVAHRSVHQWPKPRGRFWLESPAFWSCTWAPGDGAEAGQVLWSLSLFLNLFCKANSVFKQFWCLLYVQALGLHLALVQLCRVGKSCLSFAAILEYSFREKLISKTNS